ncbi:MAG TPA: UvrD-helicase domain-containing protein [Bacteroidales bacterium]|nr:UvrD-helicase domain-containing protein [Bacteroidales bacterium]
MYNTLIYNGIDPGKVRKQFDRTVDQLTRGDFAAAEVKKMAGTDFYRAKIDYENRLLFKFGCHNNQTCLLVLEIIFKHDYGKSRFLRGYDFDESKLIPVKGHNDIAAGDILPLIYVNRRHRHFHLLDKVLSFDDDQAEILALSLPQIIIGSAGSGKTVLVLEKIKALRGKVLYITLSPFLAENSARLFYSNNYENEDLDVDFLSYREFIETLHMPEGREMDFKTFESWFERNKQSSGLKDAHKTFEEFRGVITGLDISKEYLSSEDYLALGVKQSIYLINERETVYRFFRKYLNYLKENNYYDINILSHHLLTECTPLYNYIIVDEIQDFTNIQLQIILKSLLKPLNFMLCGDSNQVVYPNFFSWSHLKSMFYQSNDVKRSETKILHVNYRNSQSISGLANNLLKIKNARFGSIDKESNYLVNTISEIKGEVVFIENKGNNLSDLARKTRLSVKYAVLVLRFEDKAKARNLFQTPLLFSVQESKGLEYENIIIWNFISDNSAEYNAICDGVDQNDLMGNELDYSRGKDKTDKSHDVYKFYINSLYVAVTRAEKNIFIVEQTKAHKLIRLAGISEIADTHNIKEDISSADEWKKEARRLEMQGKNEQADAIRNNILTVQKPAWEPMTFELYKTVKKEALNPELFNKKAKDRLFDFALVYNQSLIMEKLAELKYKRAEKYESERGSIFRKYYQYYREDNIKMIIPSVNKYGIDYRDIHNFTPLHAAVYSGAVNITKTLLSSGANPSLFNTFNKTPVQIAFEQAFVSPDYAKNKLGKIYPLLLTDSMKILAYGRLIKLDSHSIEYLLINLFLAIQSVVLLKKEFFHTMGIKMDDILGSIQNFSEAVLPAYRKKREYLSAIFAKHEIDSNNPYNKKLFKRISRGSYLLNQDLQIMYSDNWIPVKSIIENQDVSAEEIREHSFAKQKKIYDEYQKKIEEAKKRRDRNRDRWRW